jgi:hypothetical protein
MMNGEASNDVLPCGKNCVPFHVFDHEISHIKVRLNSGDKALDELPKLVKAVEGLTAKVGETKDIVEAWGSIQGFGKTMKTVGVIIKVAATISSGIAIIYFLFVDPHRAIEQLKEFGK